MNGTVTLSLVLGALFSVAASCAESSQADQAAPKRDGPSGRESHQRMVATLAAIAERTEQENPFLGAAGMRLAREKLAALPVDAPPLELWAALRELGIQEMRQGETEQAMEHFGAARGLLSKLAGKLTLDQAYRSLLDLAVADL